MIYIKSQSIERHYRASPRPITIHTTEQPQTEENKDDSDDTAYTFYEDCFDRLHHHIYHLHIMGLRIEYPMTANLQKCNDDDDEIEDQIDDTHKSLSILVPQQLNEIINFDEVIYYLMYKRYISKYKHSPHHTF